ncbi:MAG: dTMP kinase [Chloroflexi bacterium RBG_19FT_COMBO_55_16]|nr:MAG: dTMP kinase [Chloroflexi bacterium RBG_19FT_COMBO_55_16]
MFITFEGPDGSGKSSQVVALAEFLNQAGYSVLVTREPGGTAIGDQVRVILSNLENTGMHPRTETLLFLAARAQLVEQVICAHLEKGDVVLCDRYADSTLAYQGFGHGNDLTQIRNLISFATGGLKPDLTILLDIDVEIGLRRRARGGEWNRLDAYNLEFHQRVRQGYHQLAQAEPERWVVIDAGQPPERVQADVRQVVMERLRVISKTGS